MKSIWKERFPIFTNQPDLIYLDHAATSQRLDTVIERMHTFNLSENANVHRGIYHLSNQATDQYEGIRTKVAKYLNAPSSANIGFTSGTTASINIVSRGYLASHLQKGDNVIVSIMEHHANFLPWQQICKEKGAELRILPLDKNGKVSVENLDAFIDQRTRLVGITHISNTLGAINPIADFCDLCMDRKVPILLDCAQSAAFHTLDVQRLNCSFLAFSGHKVFGPMGTGVLYIHDDYMSKIAPSYVGGGMIEEVGINDSTFRSFPYNLEAGTPNVPGFIGLGAAIDFLESLDKQAAQKHISSLVTLFVDGVRHIKEIKLLPHFDTASGIVSFHIDDIHPHDIAGFLNREQIALRAGMHCTQPLLNSLGLDATARVSLSIYNEEKDVQKLNESLEKLIRFWK
jgi:cysteine desulfurase/selenocysteine lyase